MADSADFIEVEIELGGGMGGVVKGVIINPDEVLLSNSHLFQFALISGHFTAQNIFVFARDWEDALEEAVHGAAEGAAPGFVYDDAQYMEQMKEAAQDLGYPPPAELSWEDDGDKLQEMEELAGLRRAYYTEAGYYDPQEWAGFFDGSQMRYELWEGVIVAALESVLDDIEDIDDVPREHRKIFLENFDLED